MGLEEYFKDVVGVIALGVEAAGVTVAAFGACQAFLRVIGMMRLPDPELAVGREIWLRFAVWIALSLEFALAADLIRTAIAIPTWASIGQLAAIAAIRTALNFFLARDMEEFRRKSEPAERARATVT